MDKKNRFKFLIIIIITISIMGIFYIIVLNNKIDIGNKKDAKLIESQIEDYLSDKITPKGIAKLYGKYDGENDLNDMYRSIYSFVNYLPILSKKVKYDNKDDIISYYESNKDDIRKNLGISNQEKFLDLIEYLNKVGYHGEKLVTCEIDTSTIKKRGKYFSFELKFNFENFANDFKLKLNFANYNSTKPMVYYSIIEEE